MLAILKKTFGKFKSTPHISAENRYALFFAICKNHNNKYTRKPSCR